MPINKQHPRFAFMGTPRFAVFVLDELEHAGLMPFVVFCAPDKPVGRKAVLTPSPVKQWALKRKLPIEQPMNKKELYAALARYVVDVSIVAAYNIIIGPRALNRPPYGTLNVHPSLLPRHRGPSPIQQTILDGDAETGVCIMQLDEEIDHGPILECAAIHLNAGETYLELEEILARKGGRLLAKILPKWLAGTVTPMAQEHANATYSKKYTCADSRVDLTRDDAHTIAATVRALNPEPGAWTIVETKKGPKRVKILSGKPKEGAYTPSRVIPESKNEMSWEDFMRGNSTAKPTD